MKKMTFSNDIGGNIQAYTTQVDVLEGYMVCSDRTEEP